MVFRPQPAKPFFQILPHKILRVINVWCSMEMISTTFVSPSLEMKKFPRKLMSGHIRRECTRKKKEDEQSETNDNIKHFFII